MCIIFICLAFCLIISILDVVKPGYSLRKEIIVEGSEYTFNVGRRSRTVKIIWLFETKLSLNSLKRY